jgi:formate C-acetyltransferase
MEEMLAALDADWKGYETLRTMILNKGKFFGNNDDFTNSMARRYTDSLYKIICGRTDYFGQYICTGNLTGYHPHFAWFGERTQATPDGRVAGSALLFGSGQANGKDKNGMTSHLLSVAQMDPSGVMGGNTIMNLSVDENTVRNDESFDKLVSLVETYFREGGLHLQLNHVSAEDMIAAQKEPDKYKSLRVRVSGFSANFVKLQDVIQDNVIARTIGKI